MRPQRGLGQLLWLRRPSRGRCYRARRHRVNVRRVLFVASVIALVAVVAVALGLRTRRTTLPATGAIAAAPDDAWLVLTVDLAAAKPLLEPLLSSRGGRDR